MNAEADAELDWALRYASTIVCSLQQMPCSLRSRYKSLLHDILAKMYGVETHYPVHDIAGAFAAVSG